MLIPLVKDASSEKNIKAVILEVKHQENGER
jgi:hypothetical protein